MRGAAQDDFLSLSDNSKIAENAGLILFINITVEAIDREGRIVANLIEATAFPVSSDDGAVLEDDISIKTQGQGLALIDLL